MYLKARRGEASVATEAYADTYIKQLQVAHACVCKNLLATQVGESMYTRQMKVQLEVGDPVDRQSESTV
jgi:hypothetical protein